MANIAPICVACKREMRCIENEVCVFDVRNAAFLSTSWDGDIYECEDCRARIITGFSFQGKQASDEQEQIILEKHGIQFKYAGAKS